MPTKPTVAVSSVGSQRDNRYLDTFRDQHRFSSIPKFADGRPWHGYRELAANKGQKDGFVGGDLIPGRHAEAGEDPREAWATIWTAPWMPEAKYFEFNYTRNRITIRYDRMRGDDTMATDTYYEAAAKLAYDKGEIIEYGAMPKYAIRAIIGDPPRSPKIAEAAMAGEPWLLGASTDVNEELAALLGLSVRGLTLRRTVSDPLVSADAVVAAQKPGELQAMIAEAVAAALAAERQQHQHTKRSHHKKSARSTTATPDAA